MAALAFGYFAWCGLVNADPWLPMRGVTFTARTDLWSFVLGRRSPSGPGSARATARSGQSTRRCSPASRATCGSAPTPSSTRRTRATSTCWRPPGIVGLAGGLFVLVRTLVIAGRAIVRAEPADRPRGPGRSGIPHRGVPHGAAGRAGGAQLHRKQPVLQQLRASGRLRAGGAGPGEMAPGDPAAGAGALPQRPVSVHEPRRGQWPNAAGAQRVQHKPAP